MTPLNPKLVNPNIGVSGALLRCPEKAVAGARRMPEENAGIVRTCSQTATDLATIASGYPADSPRAERTYRPTAHTFVQLFPPRFTEATVPGILALKILALVAPATDLRYRLGAYLPLTI